jgi:AraC-like DNA-binding protein
LTANIKKLTDNIKTEPVPVSIVSGNERANEMHSPHVSAAALSGWLRDGSGGGRVCSTLPLVDFVTLTERIAREANDESLGWKLGLRYDLSRLGPLECALRTAASLEAALTLLVGYFSLMQDSSELSLRRHGGELTINYRILDPDIWPRHQDALFTLGIIAQIVNMVSGDGWDKMQIGLECEDAARVSRLAHRVDLHCRGGSVGNSLHIPASLAALPMPHSQLAESGQSAQAGTRQALDKLLVEKRRATTVEARVRALIFKQLGDQTISQEQIARCLCMSSRTLRRHLAASRTCFQALLDDCRLRQAAHEFRVKRNVSIAQTALRLGYSEHSTFTRAFARWSGMPPQVFIRAHAPS